MLKSIKENLKKLRIQLFILLPLAIVLISQACSKMESAQFENPSLDSKNLGSNNGDHDDGLGGDDDDDTGGPPGGGVTPAVTFADTYHMPTAAEMTAMKNDFIDLKRTDNADNRYSTSIYGIGYEMVKYKNMGVTLTSLQMDSIYMNGKLPIDLYISKQGSAVRKAPLAVIVNPLYGDKSSGQMNRFIKFFVDKKYHVVVFYNSWSPTIISANSKSLPGNMQSEALMHLEVLEKVINNNIGSAKVLGATMVGVSYGSFLSTVIKRYDQLRPVPLIQGPTLVLSPPINMKTSLKAVDRQVSEASLTSVVTCATHSQIFANLGTGVNIAEYSTLSLNEVCAKLFMTQTGFKTTLVAAITSLNELHTLGLNLIERLGMTYEKYQNEVADFTVSDADADIGFNMKEAYAVGGYNKFIVLTSADDHINEGTSASQMVTLASNPYYTFNSSNSMVFAKGGHTGFRAAKSKNASCTSDWTNCFLNAVYPNF